VEQILAEEADTLHIPDAELCAAEEKASGCLTCQSLVQGTSSLRFIITLVFVALVRLNASTVACQRFIPLVDLELHSHRVRGAVYAARVFLMRAYVQCI
jgi:hypothetical protein